MNKIIVNKNIICNNNDCILVDNNKIIFKESGDYEIEYVASDNVNIEFVLENVCVNLLESSFDCGINIFNKYIIKDSKLIINKFYNNEWVCEHLVVDLYGIGSRFDYNFSNVCRKNEEYIIDINHKDKNTISNINNKSIALNDSDLKFIINSNVLDGCVKSVLNQNTRIVTMGECNAKIEPNMYIDLDDVEAKHGSVIGTFRKEQVFYLMSKGINYNDTLKLLIKGYILSNLVVNVDIRKKILDIIDIYWVGGENYE